VLQQIEFGAAEMAIGEGHHHSGAQKLLGHGGICSQKPRQLTVLHRLHRLPIERRFRQGFREVFGEHAPLLRIEIAIGQGQLVQGRQPDLEGGIERLRGGHGKRSWLESAAKSGR